LRESAAGVETALVEVVEGVAVLAALVSEVRPPEGAVWTPGAFELLLPQAARTRTSAGRMAMARVLLVIRSRGA
jgi:hypothetical protein